MNILNRLVCLGIFLVLFSGCAPLQRVQSMKNYFFDIKGERVMTPLDGRISVVGSDAECWIMFRGVITADAPRAFTLAANDADGRKCNTKWVWLESGGGMVAPAMEIGRIVRSRGYNTTLGNGAGKCASACGLIFISGVKRVVPSVLIDSKIGFHQISRRGPDGRSNCVEPNSEISTLFLFFAREMLSSNAAEKFHKNSMETDCTAMTYFGPKDMIDVGIATGMEGPNIL